MKLPSWTVPVVLRFLSLAGLTSAGGGAQAVAIGFALSTRATPATAPATETLSQPRLEDLSLDLGFFVKIANQELTLPIMPLHLLGKKSWNVYNSDNIAKVRRDEAAAKAAEEAEEQRMQELDAERRMQILRGEIPTPLAIEEAPASDPSHGSRDGRSHGNSGRERKRRKRPGENDTDFELRVAREEQEAVANTQNQLVLRKENNAPLTDHTGHISLFPNQAAPVEKNAEAEKEASKKKREYEDQYTMRFSNAAGFNQGLDNPWYSKTGERVEEDVVGKDVWGNEDPRRKERESKRILDNDPLALMKRGAAQVRQVEKERKGWREEKDREMRELEEAERRRKRKRRRENDEDELEGFSLDATERSTSKRHEGGRHTEIDRERERRHRRKHSIRSSHREEDGERHGHRHRHRSRHHD